jgi:HEPN domain-containing protein
LDWLKQEEKDLEKAKVDLDWGYSEWACFTDQQAVEKAIKASIRYLHGASNKKRLFSRKGEELETRGDLQKCRRGY